MVFKPGDKAKVVADPKLIREVWLRSYIGQEVTIISKILTHPHLKGGLGYEVQASDGKKFMAIPEALEKPLPPKKEAVGKWESTPYWQKITAPKKEPVAPGLPQPTVALR